MIAPIAQSSPTLRAQTTSKKPSEWRSGELQTRVQQAQGDVHADRSEKAQAGEQSQRQKPSEVPV